VTYNEPITFGRKGSVTNLECRGIDLSEHEVRSWTREPVAEIDIHLPLARQDVVVQFEASPFLVPDRVPAQNVFVFLSGLFVANFTLKVHAVRSFPVSRSAVSSRSVCLTLVIPTATSPLASNLSGDVRELGICLTSITFKTAS